MNEVEELRVVLEAEQEKRMERWRDDHAEEHDALWELMWGGDKYDHWYEFMRRLYWRIRRRLENVFNGWYWRRCKNRYQRSRRGWGEIDWWNLYSYLDSWLPNALRYMAKHSHGYPIVIYGADGKPIYGDDAYPQRGMQNVDLSKVDDDLRERLSNEDIKEDCDNDSEGPRVWAETLEKMALGFEACEALGDLGWGYDPSPAEVRLREIYRDGLNLFVNNYGALWD
jgi:hypothetical protein